MYQSINQSINRHAGSDAYLLLIVVDVVGIRTDSSPGWLRNATIGSARHGVPLFRSKILVGCAGSHLDRSRLFFYHGLCTIA